MSFERPYEGLRVVDMSQGVAGPYCGMLMAQNGADVIKIEPADGDWARMLGEVYGDHTAFSISANLGKRSIVMDLKNAASRDIVDRMVTQADVFIEGFRPGVTQRLGYAYERLRELNPKLIYVSVSGFGQAGPMRERPAMDPMLQAFTGFMAENKGADGIPHRTPVIFFDMATALYAQQAVGAALYARRDHGTGRKIELSLMEAAANVQAVRLLSGYRDGPFKIAASPSGTFKTQDGFMQIIVVKNREFEKFCEVLGLDDIAHDERFATPAGRRTHTDILTDRIRDVMAAKTNAHWAAALSEAGLQNEIVQTYREFAKHPQPEAIEAIAWLTQPGSDEPWPVPNIPGMPKYKAGDHYATSPTLGQHTRDIMTDLGYDRAAIDKFIDDKVIHDAP